jgi:hypothetical protein
VSRRNIERREEEKNRRRGKKLIKAKRKRKEETHSRQHTKIVENVRQIARLRQRLKR